MTRLVLPAAYIVCHDLNQSVERYTPFYEELKRSYKWARYLQNTWIILSYDPLVELSAKLRTLIFTSDRLLVMPAKGPADGWLAQDAWDWIGQHVPNEW
jgi:hypothetical protein